LLGNLAMPDFVSFLQAMGAAALASALVVLAMGGLWRPAGSARRNSACILGVCAGIAVGCRMLHLGPVWPPMSGLDRLLTVALPAVVGIELLAGWRLVPNWLAWFLRMSLTAFVGRILLHGSVYLNPSSGEWTAWQAFAVLAVCGALMAAVWGPLIRLSARSSGVSIPLALGMATLCGGMTIMLAGYVKGGAASFPLAGALVGAALAWRVKFPDASPEGMIGIGVVGLFGLLFIGRFFGEVATGPALTVLLAPLLCWATEIPPLRRLKPGWAGLLRLLLVAIPLTVVLILAKQTFDQEMAPLLG
jgi:hypothetical protein